VFIKIVVDILGQLCLVITLIGEVSKI